MQNLTERARAALVASKRPSPESAALRTALAHLLAGELEPAAEAMSSFDDPSLFLGTMFLERRGIAAGVDNIETLPEPLRDRLESLTLDYGWIGRRFEGAWAAEATGQVPTWRTSRAERGGGASSFGLLKGVEALIARDDPESAREQLPKFGWYDKRSAGRAYALVGVALDDESLMNEAVQVARKSPMIQDGGEEAEALGEVLRVFAQHGIPTAHKAVKKCVDALLKLAKKRARKDVRSYGVRIGALAAARRGGDWSDVARELLDNIWTDELKASTQLALAAHKPPDEDELLAAVQLDEEVAALYPEHLDDLVAFVDSDRKSLDKARLLRRHDLPMAHLLEEAIRENGTYWRGIERIWGHVLLADEARAEELFAAFDVHDDPELALANAAIALLEEERTEEAADYFRRALQAGFVPQYDDCVPVLLHIPELLNDAVNAIVDLRERRDRMESLSLLAQVAIELNRWDLAGEIVAHAVAGPPGEEAEAWVPWSLRGDRHLWTPRRTITVPQTSGTKGEEALAEVAELPRDQQLHAYWQLSFEIAEDVLPTLRKLAAKAPGGRGDQAQMKKGKLVQISLLVSEVDAAIDEARSMRDCRVSGWGPAYSAETIAAWLAEHPSEITIERALAVLEAANNAIPQDIPHTLASIVESLAPPLSREEQREFLTAVGAFKSKFTRAADQTAVHAIVAMGEAVCGFATAREAVSAAMKSAALGLFAGPVFFVRLLRSAGMLSDELVRPVLTLPSSSRVYQQCMDLERSARIFWDADEDSPVAHIIREENIPSEVAEQTRRSLLSMAPKYSPSPVKEVLAAWTDEPANEDLAREQIRALAAALRAEGDDAGAEELERL